MTQPRRSKGSQRGGKATGGQFAPDQIPVSVPFEETPTTSSLTPLARDHREQFRDLIQAAAMEGDLNEYLVERDYWMCQVAMCLLAESTRYPGSYTSVGGGSLLSLIGITERLSEDVDISVTFVDGADACSSHKSKKLMEECQANVETSLGIPGERSIRGGGNYFRTVHYEYPSVLPASALNPPMLKSDKGLRDAPKESLIEVQGIPYLGRFAEQQELGLAPDLAPRRVVGTHPLQILTDKLDAVCWREALVPTEGEKGLNRMIARIRDHYDIHCIIKWLQGNHLLDADAFIEACERTKNQDQTMHKKMKRMVRPQQDRPRQGYDTLRAWTPGSPEHSALSNEYPKLRSVVFGDLPPYSEVCGTIRSVSGII